MGSIFGKDGWIDIIRGEHRPEDERRHANLMVALIEIREAIEAQSLNVERGGIPAPIGHALDDDFVALRGRLMELERYTRDILAGQVTAKIAAVEKAMAAIVNHQAETAKLVQELADKVEKVEKAPVRQGPAGTWVE